MPKSLVRKALDGFQPYIPGEQPPDAEGWVKLNTNESPLPPSLQAIKDAANDALRLYPSPTAAPAREAIAGRFGLDPSQVVIGNGGDELIEMCFRAFAGAGDTVAYPTPTYPLLEPLCRIHEAEPSPHPTELPWELPPSLGPDPAPLKFIVNPNSPTGALFRTPAVEAAVAASSGLVAIDGAHPLTLDLLTVDEARQLLIARIGGGRVAAEPDAVDDLIDLCARLPLALAIAAAHAVSQPGSPVAAIARQLRTSRCKLDALTGGDSAGSR